MNISTDELVARINALAHKNKAEGLTPDEISERDGLRAEYIRRYRENLRGQLESIRIVDDSGKQSKLKKK